jgi:hypothetical protein
VVISLGLLDATGRPIDHQQLVGALADRVAVLVTDRYERQHHVPPATDPVGDKPPAPASPSPAPSLESTARVSPSPAADLADATSVDHEFAALMERVRRQASPLDPESGPASTAN